MEKDFIMNYRNAKYTESGAIDCEIEHPDYGWISTTLSADDDETSELFATVVSENNVADYVPTALTEQEQTNANIASIRAAVEAYLANLVTENGYDDRLGYAKYVGYANPLRALSEALGAHEAEVWMYCKAQLLKVTDGTRTLPSAEAFLIELPVFTVP